MYFWFFVFSIIYYTSIHVHAYMFLLWMLNAGCCRERQGSQKSKEKGNNCLPQNAVIITVSMIFMAILKLRDNIYH